MSELPLELQDQIEDADPDRHVEHRDRLVGEDHARLDGQRARDRDALALAARELVRVLLRDLVGRHEADAREQLAHAPVDRAARADAVDLQRPRDVVIDALDRIERRERILEDHLHVRAVVEQRPAPPLIADVLAVEDDLAVGRRVQAREQPRDGALAAAALAHERRHVARAERERNIGHRVEHLAPERRRTAHREALAEVLNLERAHRASTQWQATRWPGSKTSQARPVRAIIETWSVSHGRATLGQEPGPAEPWEFGQARFDDRPHRLELAMFWRTRTIPRSNGLDRLIQQPVLDPAVQRRAPNANAARGFGAITVGFVQQLMEQHTREHSVHTGLAGDREP